MLLNLSFWSPVPIKQGFWFAVGNHEKKFSVSLAFWFSEFQVKDYRVVSEIKPYSDRTNSCPEGTNDAQGMEINSTYKTREV